MQTIATLLAEHIPLERFLPAFTRNVADLLRPHKGRIEVGADADLTALTPDGKSPRSRTRVVAGERRPTSGIRALREVKRVSPAKVEDSHTRGWIVPVGGAEDKEQDAVILRRFVEVSGGSAARIAIIPTASRLPDTGPRYERIFRKLGATRPPASPSRPAPTPNATTSSTPRASHRRLPHRRQPAPALHDPRRHPRRPRHPPPQRPRRHRRRHLGRRRDPLRTHDRLRPGRRHTQIAGLASLAPGFGLTNRLVIDQHFRQRDRLGRLLSVLAFNPFAVGIGLDEDTAAFIDPRRRPPRRGRRRHHHRRRVPPRALLDGPRQEPARPSASPASAPHPHPQRHLQPPHPQVATPPPPPEDELD
jgi:cyanophycinase